MKHAALTKTLKYIAFVLAFCAVAAGLFLLISSCDSIRTAKTGKDADTDADSHILTVVIDAGHGGEDGGTSDENGTPEKNLNLDIAFHVKEILEATGVRVIMTRTEDILLYDRNTDYKGRKKVLDLAARLAVGEKITPDLFVSIHMNAFPDRKYHGLQVWYSPNDGRSEEYAERIQKTVAAHLQNDNTRHIKKAGSNIFLLDRLHCPAVLVECGFLSNPDEAARLSDPVYRRELAFFIASAILDGAEKTGQDGTQSP